MDSNIENQLMNIINDLGKIKGIEGNLIADNNGNIICHNMSRETDVSLFGSMAHVITGSSKRLLNSTNQGEIQRVLVESHGGKALFLHLGNVYFIVLMEMSANVGLVMVSAKKSAVKIIELTKDMVSIKPTEESYIQEKVPEKTEIDKRIKIEDISKEEAAEIVDNLVETEDIKEAFSKVTGTENVEKILESEEIKALDSKEAEKELIKLLEPKIGSSAKISAEKSEEIKEPELKEELEVEVEIEEIKPQDKVEKELKEQSTPLPIIKPPISFPKLPENVKIPEDDKERSDLILDIYESLFLAMSIGASKIMGVSPARGLIKRFLPLDDCKSLLNDVDVKSNSAIDFDKIRENAENIPLNERENTLITSFSKIIDIITENYGKVMGYGAFRGIVRSEFKIITAAYGEVMAELKIKDKLHPELKELFK
jgi:predicted regulator of Ras-like GTPase activity (Roadblock/LC7/MglB family)